MRRPLRDFARISGALIVLAFSVIARSAGPTSSNGADIRHALDEIAEAAAKFERLGAPRIGFSHLLERRYMSAISKDAAGQYYVGGARGVLLSARENGDWTQLESPTDVLITAITVDRKGRLWVGGSESTILHKGAAGSWEQVRHGALDGPILDIAFITDSFGVALGTFGLLLRTQDGGKTWNRVQLETEDGFTPHLFAIEAIGADLFVVGEQGAVFRSSDGGESWAVLRSPFNGSLFGAAATVTGTLIVYGITGHVFFSVDRGEKWEEIKTNWLSSLFAHAVDDTALLIGGADGVVLRILTVGDRPVLDAVVSCGDGDVTGLVRISGSRFLLATTAGLKRVNVADGSRRCSRTIPGAGTPW